MAGSFRTARASPGYTRRIAQSGALGLMDSGFWILDSGLTPRAPPGRWFQLRSYGRILAAVRPSRVRPARAVKKVWPHRRTSRSWLMPVAVSSRMSMAGVALGAGLNAGYQAPMALRLAVLLAAAWSAASAQDEAEILRRTAETYRSLHSFEASGVLSTQIALSGVSYDVTWPLSLAQADSTLLPPGSPVPVLSPLIRFGRKEFRDPAGQIAPLETATPSSPNGWSLFDQIDQGVQAIRDLRSETIEFDGKPTACWALEVVYEPGFPTRALSERPVRYWINQSNYLVIRQSFAQRDPSQSEFIEWVFTVTSMQLNEPPPAWALEALPQLAGYERTEWNERPAPDFILADLDGREVSLAALRGQAVLLSFWASWCVPCKEEMPLIERLAAEFGPRGLEVWGITNESAGKARAWLDRYGRSLPTLVDAARKVFRDYEAEKIPVSIVVDRGGRVVSYRVGLSGEAHLRAAIERALGIGSEKP